MLDYKGLASEFREKSIDEIVRLSRLSLMGLVIGSLLFGVVALAVDLTGGPLIKNSPSMVIMFAVVTVVTLIIGPAAAIGLKKLISFNARNGKLIGKDQVWFVIILTGGLISFPAMFGASAALLCGWPFLLATIIGCWLLILWRKQVAELVMELTGESQSDS